MGAWRPPEVQLLQHGAIMELVPGGHRKCSYYSMELSWFGCLEETGSEDITAKSYHAAGAWRPPEVQLLQHGPIMVWVPGGHWKYSYYSMELPEVQLLQYGAIMVWVPGGHWKYSYYSTKLSWN
ncbi:hypothetical protein NDU88_000839 [Pleurodeles waltl]|uniref:Uncharacterized protein n=1 Tax=Pleurodeles waltl TaxID=8319 RepID=A0AAV7LWQ1_PLEWA|nr:hypothetical protein NDU88_000839 [Pleurodeles waltl]